MNAIIHADYQGLGGIVIEKYPDRFEFSNPGSLLISIDQLLYSNISECRNKFLQTMFTMIGAAERAGSGIDKIRVGWSSQHWRSPIIKELVQPERVLWVLPMTSLIPEESLVKLKKRFGLKFSKFNQLQIQALVTADVEGYVDNARMRQIGNKHAADVTRLLQDLVSQGALTQDGQGRWTRYCLSPAFGSVHKEGGSVHKEGLSCSDRDPLLLIAEPARKNRRLPPMEMEQIILRLCEDSWLTRRELAELLDRSLDGLRSRFLTQMVSHGLLRLRYPDKPNRADQAYSTVVLNQPK